MNNYLKIIVGSYDDIEEQYNDFAKACDAERHRIMHTSVKFELNRVKISIIVDPQPIPRWVKQTGRHKPQDDAPNTL
jgi:hypothetical protein